MQSVEKHQEKKLCQPRELNGYGIFLGSVSQFSLAWALRVNVRDLGGIVHSTMESFFCMFVTTVRK
jgi:hypothetical protein